MAVLCRCDDYEEIAGWVAARHAWLAQVLGLPAARTPCRKTFERLFRQLASAALTDCFVELAARLAKASDGRLIAIDGKTLRGSVDHAHWSLTIHLHWCLDVSFGDDAARVRKDHGPENLAAVKRHVLVLVKRSTPPASTPLGQTHQPQNPPIPL